MPPSSWSQGKLVVVTVERRLFLFAARAAGWPWCKGGGGFGGCTRLSNLRASSSLPRHRDAQSVLRPPPSPEAPVFEIWRRPHLARRSAGPATLGLAAIPRPNGAGERTSAKLGLNICAPVKEQQRRVVSPSLSPIGVSGNTKLLPKNPALRERRGCRAAGTV